MARDHGLARDLPAGRAILRLYRWARPTLSLGRNEPARDRVDPRELERLGVELVRRPTGGRAVLHHRELTYAVVLPVRGLGGPRPAYRALHRALLVGLRHLGVEAGLARDPVRRSPGPEAGPCFREPAGGELVAGGRKLVGSAQVRIGSALLQHGSILLADDQALARRLAPPPPGSAPVPGPATLEDVLGSAPPPARVGDAVIRGFEEVVGARWSPVPPELDTGPPADLLERYGSPAWSWRR